MRGEEPGSTTGRCESASSWLHNQLPKDSDACTALRRAGGHLRIASESALAQPPHKLQETN